MSKKKGKSLASAQRRAKRRELMRAALVAYRLSGASAWMVEEAKKCTNIGQINWSMK